MTSSPAASTAGAGKHTARPPGRDLADTAELAEAQAQLREAHETIEAIRAGGVDSLVIGRPGDERIYTLASADRPYRLIVEAMNEGAATISPRGVILDANARLGSMIGRTAKELVGTAVVDLVDSAQRTRFAQLLDVGVGRSARGELDLTGPDGIIVPVLLAVSGFDLDSVLLRSVILTDLSDRRIAEGRLAEAYQALRRSEARLRALVDHAPVGIDDLGPGGEIIGANPRFCEITGYRVDELLTMRPQDITHPDDIAADTASMERLLSGEIDAYSLQKRYVRKDGDVVWAEMNRAVVRDANGAPVRFVSAVRDITAQLRAETEVRALTAALESRVAERTADLERVNQNLEAFTSSVSHDLRAPLRAMSGFSQALVEDYGELLDQTGRGYTARIQAASEQMATLIDDLLQLSRVARAEMQVGPVDLSAEVAAIIAELQARDPGREVRFAIQDGVRVVADRTLIRTVLQNLVENAWKFTSRRDDAVIEFGTTSTEDAGVCCFVRDNGAGFDPDYADKLFKPFQRLHAVTDFPGTGIGLASAAGIIQRHRGRIWAQGAVGSGATFYFTLSAEAAG
jgi:PAS domain S-box-containing protein